MMERILNTAKVTAAAALIVVPGALAGRVAATAAQAERNILSASAVLDRWQVGITDSKTGLVRANTTVTCRGKGRHLAKGYGSFTCVIRRRTLRVRVLYVALTRNGFELHDHILLHR